MTHINNIAGYYFVELNDCEQLKQKLQTLGQQLNLLGTILLSPEGINIMLSAPQAAIDSFCQQLQQDPRLAPMQFKHSYSATTTFKRFLVKLKKEIITMRQPQIDAQQKTAPRVSASTLKQWLDEGKSVVLLDTRNDYEIALGHFKGAVDLDLQHFVDFPEKIDDINTDMKQKTVVTYCTGGIRCEKASAYMLDAGFTDVYQLDGGILQYFAECGGDHYDGECFVFDKRIAVDPQLQPSQNEACQAIDC